MRGTTAHGTGLAVTQDISGDGLDASLHNQLRGVGEGIEAQVGQVARLDAVDELRHHLGLEHKPLVVGDDVHELLTRCHHTTDGLRGQADHLPGGRRADLGALEFEGERLVALAGCLHLRADVGQLAVHLLAVFGFGGDLALTDLEDGLAGADLA